MNTADFYSNVTEKMLLALKSGTAPWVRPWSHGGEGVPVNAVTGKPYRGINVLNLSWQALSVGTVDMRFATFKQAMEKGWKIRSGARGIPVLKLVPIRKQKKEEQEEGTPEQGREPLIPKVYFVFGAENLEGMPPLDGCPGPVDWSGQAEFLRKKLSGSLGVPVSHGGGRAFYSHLEDRIQLPVEGCFLDEAAYLGTLFHEFGHATGHEKRLHRVFGLKGDPAYAFEELVAEMTSLFVSMVSGIAPDENHFDNHAAYVDSWIQILDQDHKALVRASRMAQEACDLLMGCL